jgi:stage II sporulation protein P
MMEVKTVKKTNKGKIFMALVVLLLFPSLILSYSFNFNPIDRIIDEIGDEIGESGKYFVVYEQNTDNEIFTTGWHVHKGDRYLSGDNKMYEVVKVEKNYKAYAKLVGDVTLPVFDETMETSVQQQNKGKVGIYQTHSSESYVPTDGKESILGGGGILKVGASLKESLEKRGIEVDYRDTIHDPHDAGAYKRSRTTATNILKGGADSLLDIHRDAIPKEQYIKDLNNEPISKVRIVIGRRNQNKEANEQLAQKIKAVADKKYPGLIKDIFYARGDYNQDLIPNSLLFEMGTYEHSRERAEKSTEYLADVISTAMYGGQVKEPDKKTPTQVKPISQENKGSNRGIITALIVVVLGGAAFLFISTGGKEIRSKVSNFKREFSNFLGSRRKRK